MGKTQVYIIGLVIILGSLLAPFTFMEKIHAQDKFLNYSVHPVLPENQKTGITNYFHLNEPEEGQKLEILIKNLDEKELHLKLMSLTGTTSDHADIQYSDKKEVLDGGLLTNDKYIFSSYIELDEHEISIPSGQSKRVPFTVYPPNVNVGTILGGILTYPAKDDDAFLDENNSGEAAFQIQSLSNRHVIAVVLNTGEKLAEGDQLDVGEPWFQLTPSMGMVRLPLRHISPAILKMDEFKYNIYDGDEKLFSGKRENLSFAPLSKANLIIPWDHETLESGDYIIKGEIRGKDDTYKFSRDFTIDLKQHEKNDNRDRQSRAIQEKAKWWLWLLLLIFLLILIYTFIKLYQKKKRKHEEKSKTTGGENKTEVKGRKEPYNKEEK